MDDSTRHSADTAPLAPNPWVRVHSDGTVVVLIDRSEMGQGVATALAMLVAEELEVPLEDVRTQFAPAAWAYRNPIFGEQLTGGSTSLRAAWEPLRHAGAQAREMLVAAAAERWRVPTGECQAEAGSVLHPDSGRGAAYGELVAAARDLPVPRRVQLKPAARFRLLGRPTARLDIPAMVAGRTRYGLDVRVDGMLMAAVARCPVTGGTPRRFDPSPAKALAGVEMVVALPHGVAVLARDSWSALQGRDALQVEWETGALESLSTERIRNELAAAVAAPEAAFRSHGDVAAALSGSARSVQAVYHTPYLAHGTLEPMNCTADVRADGCDLWVGTQAQQASRELAAGLTGLPKSKVKVHTLHLGGGFGRRGETDFVGEAVRLSRATGRPVQVLWSRTDDMAHDRYRPASCVWLQAGLDSGGRPVSWHQRIAGPPLAMDSIQVAYTIPNQREERIVRDPGLPTGAWRSVGASQNAFAIECFMDELAHAAGADPLEYRLALLSAAPRHRRVLEYAAERAGWGRILPADHGMGLAVYRSFGGWVAQVAEVSVCGDDIRVHRIVAAIDCGFAVNPTGVKAQVEGAVAFGLSAALYEEITVRAGRVEQTGFDNYPILAIDRMPEVEVHVVPSDAPPGGVGEPGVPPVAPAVANAVFAATGVRLRRLPLGGALRTAGG